MNWGTQFIGLDPRSTIFTDYPSCEDAISSIFTKIHDFHRKPGSYESGSDRPTVKRQKWKHIHRFHKFQAPFGVTVLDADDQTTIAPNKHTGAARPRYFALLWGNLETSHRPKIWRGNRNLDVKEGPYSNFHEILMSSFWVPKIVQITTGSNKVKQNNADIMKFRAKHAMPHTASHCNHPYTS